MATLQMLINLFPEETGSIQGVAAVLLGGIALGLGIKVTRILRRAARRRHAAACALSRGLGAGSAQFLAELLRDDAPAATETLLGAPDLLVRRLVLEITRQRGGVASLACAARAAQVLSECGLAEPAFEGAPLPCEPLRLSDPAELAGAGVLVFVVAVDERNLVAMSASPCPWPLRRNLFAVPQLLPGASAAENEALRPAFEVALLLGPMPPRQEWVFTHALVDTITNRRSSVRVPCRLETVTLPDSGDPLLLRQRLQREERVALDELRGTRAWSQRLTVTVTDLSADGARLVLDQPLERHARLHLLLTGPDGSLLALPLAEVVDSRHDAAGRTLAGLRFIGVLMKERLRLAEHVRALAAPATQGAAASPRSPQP